MLLMLLIGQVIAGRVPTDFDLADFHAARPGCNSDSGPSSGEIVVCAKRNQQNDVLIKQMPLEPLIPKAEFKLFGKVRGKIAGEQGNVGPIPTNRAMVTMSVPF